MEGLDLLGNGQWAFLVDETYQCGIVFGRVVAYVYYNLSVMHRYIEIIRI